MILGIYGSGGLGREILDLAKVINAVAGQWERVVFINDFKDEEFVNDTEVLPFVEFKTVFSPDNTRISIAIGEPKIRKNLREKVEENGYQLQTLVHPTAFIGTNTLIGDGAIIQFGSFVSCNVILGTNALVQSYATIGHDSVIGNDVVISTFVAVSGACMIGDRTYIGINVPVREKAQIGDDTIVGMGSAVLRDIPSNVVALGNPARVVRENISGYVFKQEG